MGEVKSNIRRVFRTFNKMEMRILPGNIAFFFVLALIPLISFVAVFASYFHISMDNIITLVRTIVPGDASNIIVDVISGKGFDGSIGIFNVIALLSASNGTYAVITASNTLYKVKDRDALKDRIKSFILLLILLFLLLFLILVPLFGEKILLLFKSSSVISNLKLFYRILKWPVTVFLIYMNLKLIYTIAPGKKISSVTTTNGAIFTTVLWTLATAIFSSYLKYFANYNVVYGNLSSLIILMMWLYIISYVFVMGIAINATSLDE